MEVSLTTSATTTVTLSGAPFSSAFSIKEDTAPTLSKLMTAVNISSSVTTLESQSLHRIIRSPSSSEISFISGTTSEMPSMACSNSDL